MSICIVIGRGLGNKVVEDKIPTAMVAAQGSLFIQGRRNSPDLSLEQLEVGYFGSYMDMEFTSIKWPALSLAGATITTAEDLLDNSNIVEAIGFPVL